MEITPKWRAALALDSGVFATGVFFFAALPTSTIVLVEVVLMAASALCLIGLTAYAIPKVRLPGDRWSYLLTAALSISTFAIYAQVESVPAFPKVPFLIFLLGGAVSGYAAHIVDGGQKHG